MSDEVKYKKDAPSSITQPVKLGSKLNSFHRQVIEGAKTEQQYSSAANPTSTYADMSTTVIFPDCSGSMSDVVGGYAHGGSELRNKVYYCREAVATFLDNCFAGATRVGIASFPELVVVEPTLDLLTVKHAAKAINATGGTPMDEPLDFVIHEWPVTHGIVISDGCPDSEKAVLNAAQLYKEKNVKLDTVHIGDKDELGESLMKRIAELTGGVYIKFSNMKNFAENFKYLTPQHRLTLTTSKNPIALLGAADVKL
jgi:hypothetical protein